MLEPYLALLREKSLLKYVDNGNRVRNPERGQTTRSAEVPARTETEG